MTASTLQYRRVAEVVVGSGGNGVDIPTDFRIQLEIVKDVHREPNAGHIKIYNLSPDNETKLRTEFKDVIVNCGYVGNVLLAFRGNIRHAWRFREGNDWISQIDAGDGDLDFRTSIVNRTLAAGTSNLDTLDACVKSFKTTKLGHAPLTKRTRGRAKVICGPARDELDALALEENGHWSIQDSNLDIIAVDSTLPTEAIVVRSDTGMLGAPEISDKGIKVTCLLNPRIHCNGKLQLDNNDLRQQIHDRRVSAKGKVSKDRAPIRLDPDGIYKVYKLVHRGDTRGTDPGAWVTEAHCIALGQPIPPQQGAVPS